MQGVAVLFCLAKLQQYQCWVGEMLMVLLQHLPSVAVLVSNDCSALWRHASPCKPTTCAVNDTVELSCA